MGAHVTVVVFGLVGGTSSMAGFLVGLPFFRMQIFDCHRARHQRQEVDLVSDFSRELKEPGRRVIAARSQ